MFQLKFYIFFHLIAICCFPVTNEFIMKMIPIDSPDLKVIPQGYTSHERHQLFTNISLSRALRYRKNLSPNEIKTPMYRVASSLFVTRLQFGDREGHEGFYSPYLLLDTGTDLTWVQCEGCNPCFELSYGNFPYTESTSFSRVALNDPLCLPPSFDFEGSCGYSRPFGFKEASTHGILGREEFYFASEGGHGIAYSNLLLGCGLVNENFNFLLNNGHQNVIAGVQGLGSGEESIISQLNDDIKGRFSYCLTPLTRQSIAEPPTMYFGDNAQISGDATRQVQTISMSSHGLYHLYLSSISVEDYRLDIDPFIFELDETDFTKGFFIDSGSPYTMLAKSAYDPLKEEIIEFFRDEYGWNPDPTRGTFDLCYSVPDHEYDEHYFPTVTLHFLHLEYGEVNMVLGKDNMFQKMTEEYGGNEGFCFMVVKVDDPGPCIFGAFQQVNFKILHDIYNSALSFVPQNCLQNS
ncbi:hypothetical protein RND81_07G122400 [Saponaria officinalis]|uniref:Peptidase A1 domain-containing protein n=1 Tax=Saponaria officinalis TaxID=3572 RepID=A0AAW1JR79_SAPOF